MHLSIIIPAFNEEVLIPQTMEAIKEVLREIRRSAIDWEIIVCDNNSTDRTGEIAAALGARVVFESERQISRARNSGAVSARGKWLLFIDADTHPRRELMLEVADIIDGDSYVGCGATVEVVGGTLFNKLRMERLNPIFRLLGFCGGAFILCRRDAFESIGGFSTGLFAYEEIDFIFRLKTWGRKHGMKFVVLHEYPVVTSGRRANYTVGSLLVLVLSNFAAVVLFVAHYVLPKRLVSKLGKTLLGYWYSPRT